MDFDQLRQQWKAQADRISALETENAELQRRLKCNTYDKRRRKLLFAYRLFFVLPVVMIPCTFLCFSHLDLPLLTSYLFSIIFFIEAIGNLYILLYIKGLDFTMYSTRELLRRLIRLQKMRRVLQLFYILLLIPVITYAFSLFYASDGVSVVLGGIAGSIVGAILGIKKDREIHQTINLMRKDLEEIESPA